MAASRNADIGFLLFARQAATRGFSVRYLLRQRCSVNILQLQNTE
jgi:hypothetical protein